MQRVSWISIALMLVLLVAGGCIQSSGPPSKPGVPVAPNASVVTAKVLKYSVWESELLDIKPSITLYSLVLEVLMSETVSNDLANLIKPGDVIEAFTKEALGPELLGRRIRVTVSLEGDEHGQRAWIVDGIKTLETSQ